MKNFLAIDTSCAYMTVLVGKGEETFSTFLSDCAMKHSVNLLPAVEETLQKANLRLEDCDVFSAVVGAGSFTGLRIAISAVKGFCLATKKPALPITSFDVVAYNAIEKGNFSDKILCLVDALHDSYYACGYQNGEVTLAPAYLSEEEVLALEKEGYRLASCLPLPLSERANVEVYDPLSGLEKAVRALMEKERFGDLQALYVRKSSAELNQA